MPTCAIGANSPSIARRGTVIIDPMYGPAVRRKRSSSIWR
jgi:hypothetical protein